MQTLTKCYPFKKEYNMIKQMLRYTSIECKFPLFTEILTDRRRRTTNQPTDQQTDIMGYRRVALPIREKVMLS